MSTALSLETDAQKMIDYRLDTLDRLLISSGMVRAERMDVVQSVEDQIHELVDRRSKGERTREDVVHVLSELDPPEAYVSNWSNLRSDEPRPRIAMNQPKADPVAHKHSVLGVVSFVLALLGLLFMVLMPIGTFLGIVSFVCSTICLAQSRNNQHLLWMPIVANCSFALHLFAVIALLFLQN